MLRRLKTSRMLLVLMETAARAASEPHLYLRFSKEISNDRTSQIISNRTNLFGKEISKRAHVKSDVE